MMPLCTRHDDMLQFALELRGLLRPTLVSDADLTPLHQARTAILTHASHYAGRAAIEMLETKTCPLCYVNAKNPERLNLDGWIENAADEAEAAALAREDGETSAKVLIT